MREPAAIPLHEALDAFADYLLFKGRSPNTVATYGHLLKPLRRLLSDDAPATDLTAAICWQLLGDKVRAGKLAAAQTLHGALGSFSSFLVERQYIAANPLAGIPCPKARPKPHRYLTEDELRRLWAAAAAGRRPAEDQLLLCLLLEGLRGSELVGLRWRDVLSDRIVVAFTKGGEPRAVPLRPRTRELLDARPHDGAAIFTLTRPGLYRRVQRLGLTASIPGLHPHVFRHTMASWHLLKGGDSLSLQQLGGWSSDRMIAKVYARSARQESALDAARRLDLTELLLGQHAGPPPNAQELFPS